MRSGVGSPAADWAVGAPPVDPVAPEFPERAAGMKDAVELAGPVSPEDDLLPAASPVEPDDPESATGLAHEVDAAQPVSPVLVADDWAVVPPERPEMAVGMTVTSTDPPLPPLASPSGTELAVTAPV